MIPFIQTVLPGMNIYLCVWRLVIQDHKTFVHSEVSVDAFYPQSHQRLHRPRICNTCKTLESQISVLQRNFLFNIYSV